MTYMINHQNLSNEYLWFFYILFLGVSWVGVYCPILPGLPLGKVAVHSDVAQSVDAALMGRSIPVQDSTRSTLYACMWRIVRFNLARSPELQLWSFCSCIIWVFATIGSVSTKKKKKQSHSFFPTFPKFPIWHLKMCTGPLSAKWCKM